MRNLMLAAIAAALFSSCASVKTVEGMDTFIARYSNGYVLDPDWEVIGYARNGYIMNEKNEVEGRYANGRVYDNSDSLVAVYANGCIYSDRILWDLYDRLDMSDYIKSQHDRVAQNGSR